MAKKKASKGDKVTIEYTGTLESGEVFDSSDKHDKPLEFEVGAGQVIPGFDNAVDGMEKGEEKEFTIEPEDAYGEHNPQLVKEIKREQIPDDSELEEGMTVLIGLPNGAQVPARIVEVSDDTVKLDLNHPLAGEKLKFKVKLVGISEGGKEEKKPEKKENKEKKSSKKKEK